MTRILHVLYSMSRGGMQAFLMDVYRQINHDELQFDFLLEKKVDSEYVDEIIKLGGRIHYIPPRREGVSKNKKALEKFFADHPQYKIVHQHVSSLTYVTPLKLAKKFKVPVRIIHSHNTRQGGSFIHRYIHSINQLSVKSYATDYFACSTLAARWLYGKKQFNNGDYEIFNNGINTKDFIFNEEARVLKREEFGVEENTFLIGHIGRFVHQKNHDFLIDIFQEVINIRQDSLLLLVGYGELQEQMEEKVRGLGLEDKVIFTGVRSDVKEIIQAMDVFVLPSHHEGLGIVVIESQASGLPTIVSEAVPEDAYVTDLIEKEHLKSTPVEWAQRILKYAGGYTRRNTYKEITDAGYDVADTAKKLQEWYKSKAGGSKP